MNFEAAIKEIINPLIDASERRMLAQISQYGDVTMTVQEAAEHIRISDKLLYSMCKRKLIPHERYGMPGSARTTIRFRLLDLEIWRAEQRAANYIGVTGD